MQRPDHLPDYKSPPLNEVVIGIQFAQPTTYQQIRAGEVWALFKNRFPVVQELPPLAPYFETFGQPGGAQINLGFISGAQHDRFWFLTPNSEELIQFQNDRFLQNWRKVPRLNNEYPRFEKIIDDFEKDARCLDDYFKSIGSQSLDINQCEISYINHISSKTDLKLRASDWISFTKLADIGPDDFSFSFRRTIESDEGKRIGRLTLECQSGASSDGREIINLTITARAMPKEPNLKSALEFFVKGREMIVNLFTESTTDSAHKVWERVK